MDIGKNDFTPAGATAGAGGAGGGPYPGGGPYWGYWGFSSPMNLAKKAIKRLVYFAIATIKSTYIRHKLQ